MSNSVSTVRQENLKQKTFLLTIDNSVSYSVIILIHIMVYLSITEWQIFNLSSVT